MLNHTFLLLITKYVNMYKPNPTNTFHLFGYFHIASHELLYKLFFQMKQIRTALAVALLLNRTLVRPTKPLRSMFLCFVVVFATLIDFMHQFTRKSYVLYNDYLIVSLCLHFLCIC